jgi:hypothetical protein
MHPKIGRFSNIHIRLVVALGIALAFLALAVFVWPEWIKPEQLSISRMRILENRIREYHRNMGIFPQSLAQLPPVQESRESKDTSIYDGWGEPISLAIEGSRFYLISNGGEAGKKLIHSFIIPTRK